MGALFLDLGVRTGWAYKGDEDVVKSGVEYFPVPKGFDRFSTAGKRFLRFYTWLNTLLDDFGDVDSVVYELVEGNRGSMASYAYGGFMAILMMVCQSRGIVYSGLPVRTLKKRMTGHGDSNKHAMMEAVRMAGYDFNDDNEADALALLIVMCYK